MKLRDRFDDFISCRQSTSPDIVAGKKKIAFFACSVIRKLEVIKIFSRSRSDSLRLSHRLRVAG